MQFLYSVIISNTHKSLLLTTFFFAGFGDGCATAAATAAAIVSSRLFSSWLVSPSNNLSKTLSVVSLFSSSCVAVGSALQRYFYEAKNMLNFIFSSYRNECNMIFI